MSSKKTYKSTLEFDKDNIADQIEYLAHKFNSLDTPKKRFIDYAISSGDMLKLKMEHRDLMQKEYRDHIFEASRMSKTVKTIQSEIALEKKDEANKTFNNFPLLADRKQKIDIKNNKESISNIGSTNSYSNLNSNESKSSQSNSLIIISFVRIEDEI